MARSMADANYFFSFFIRSPGSALLELTRRPCSSLVVPNLSLVRPVTRLAESLTTVSLPLSSTKPMTFRCPSLTTSFDILFLLLV
jgi:hypothetical protein